VKFSTILHCFSVEVQHLLLQQLGTPTNHDALVAHPSSGEIIRYNPGMLPIWLIYLPLSCALVVENLLVCSYCFSTSKTNKSKKRTSTVWLRICCLEEQDWVEKKTAAENANHFI
jgi:hypothetical protein